MQLTAALQGQLPQVDGFQEHLAKFNRSLHRLRRAQKTLPEDYIIVFTSHQLYEFLRKSISHLPQFAPLMASFATSHASILSEVGTRTG